MPGRPTGPWKERRREKEEARVEAHGKAAIAPLQPRTATYYATFLLLGTSVMLAALAWDVRSRVMVDGLHWAGVATRLVIAALQFATYYK